MEHISDVLAAAPSSGVSETRTFGDMSGEDFLGLLIMQLKNQDPLEPMGNEELLGQIASLREIELSSALTESLEFLTGQQRFSSASSLIGQFVTGPTAEDGTASSGVVVGVRFTQDGQPVLQLAGGNELPLEEVSTISSPLKAAEELIGRGIVGMDGRNPTAPEVVEGVVTGVRVDAQGEVLLELDTGQDLRFRDVLNLASMEMA